MRIVAVALAGMSVAAVTALRVTESGGSSAPATTASASASSRELPPDDFAELARIFDPILRPHGLRLTRGGLADGPGSKADASLRGRHLAVYVEPLDAAHSERDYLDTLVSSAQAFLPGVFEAWPGLASMDVCQEPPPGVDDRRVPPPVTVLEVTREQAEAVDWLTLDLPVLVAAGDEQRVSLFVAEELIRHDRYVRARLGAD